MKIRVSVMASLCAMLLLSSTCVNALADAAPDGMTKAEETAAAANGAWDSWKEEWETLKTDWTKLSINPGVNETELNFAWYSRQGSVPVFRFAKTEDMSDAAEYTAVQTAAALDGDVQYMSNKVTVTGLEENTTYYYSYQINGEYTTPVKYETQDFDSFHFIFVGDPQIGSSNEKKSASKEDAEALQIFLEAQDAAVRNDSFNWNNTLNQAEAETNAVAQETPKTGDHMSASPLLWMTLFLSGMAGLYLLLTGKREERDV